MGEELKWIIIERLQQLWDIIYHFYGWRHPKLLISGVCDGYGLSC
jgi:hypothetical protein